MKRTRRELPTDLATAKKLVIVKPSSLGDIVHTLPSVRALKRSFPQLDIWWAANPEWLPLLRGNPDLAGTVEFPRHTMRGWRAPFLFLRFARRLRQGPAARPDAALDFQGLLRSALIARAFHPQMIAGLSDAREGAGAFYDITVDAPAGAHAADRYLALAAAMGARLPDSGAEFPLPRGARHPESAARGEGAIALHPFSRGAGKSLSEDDVTRFCRRVAPHPVVILGAGTTSPGFERQLPPSALNLVGRTTIHELIGELRAAAFTVSVDSGPMHVAAALSARVLSIHTWTDPRRVGPYPLDALVWKAGRITRRRDLAPSEAASVTPADIDAIADCAVSEL